MESPNYIVSTLCKIASALFVCGFLCFNVWFHFLNKETALAEESTVAKESRSPKAKTVHRLHEEFKEGSPSLNFIERTRQLGAEKIWIETPDGKHLYIDSDSKGFEEFNTKYKAMSEGNVRALFRPRLMNIHGYDVDVDFKRGKVTQAKIYDVVACPDDVVDPSDSVETMLNIEKH